MTDICRLCGDLKPLEGLSCLKECGVAYQLENHLKINLESDKMLPNSVCELCCQNVSFCCDFLERVKTIQEKLKADLEEQTKTGSDFSSIDDVAAEEIEIKVERFETSPIIYEPSHPADPLQEPSTLKRRRSAKSSLNIKKQTRRPQVDNTSIGFFEDRVQECSSILVSQAELEKIMIKVNDKWMFNSKKKGLKGVDNYQNVFFQKLKMIFPTMNKPSTKNNFAPNSRGPNSSLRALFKCSDGKVVKVTCSNALFQRGPVRSIEFEVSDWSCEECSKRYALTEASLNMYPPLPNKRQDRGAGGSHQSFM